MVRTRHGRHEVTLDYDDGFPAFDATDTLGYLELDDASISTASASIVSNWPGAGRTVGNLVSKIGRKIERSLNLGGPTDTQFRLTLRFDDARDLLAFSRTASAMHCKDSPVVLYPVSVSTASNLPGPGRTLDKLFSALGRRFDGLFSRAGDRIGMGPTNIVRKIRPRSNNMLHCVLCGQWKYSSPMYFGRTLNGEPFSVEVLNWIFQAACTTCRPTYIESLSKDERFCLKLVKVLQSKNMASLHQAIMYIATFLSLHPNFRITFSALGLSSALEDLYDRWGQYRDTDALLARSHRVLQFVAEDKVLHNYTRLQEIELALNDHSDVWSDGTQADDLLCRYRYTLVELLQLTLDSRLGGLAAMQIMLATVHNTWRYGRMSNLCSAFTPLIERWWHLVACGDTVISKMLVHIYNNVADTDTDLIWKTMLIPALHILVLPGRNHTSAIDFFTVETLIVRYVEQSSFRLEMGAEITDNLRVIQSQAINRLSEGDTGAENLRDVRGWCELLLSPYFTWYAAVKGELDGSRSGIAVMLRTDRYFEICSELVDMLPRCGFGDKVNLLRKVHETIGAMVEILYHRTLSILEQTKLEELLEHLSDFQRPDSIESRSAREKALLDYLESQSPPTVVDRTPEPVVMAMCRLDDERQESDDESGTDSLLAEIVLSPWTRWAGPNTRHLRCQHADDWMRWIPVSDYHALSHCFALICAEEECILSTEDDEGELQYFLVARRFLEEQRDVFEGYGLHVLSICRSKAKEVYWDD